MYCFLNILVLMKLVDMSYFDKYIKSESKYIKNTNFKYF